MNSRRLARLMGIICEIKAHPRRDPDEMCQRLGISRRQFYKDRETLAELGFAFHYSRRRLGFVLDKELTFNLSGIGLAEFFALILGARELAASGEFALAMGALSGLRGMIAQLPDELQTLFTAAVDALVVMGGFGCRPQVLEALPPAIDEKRRVILVMENGPPEERLPVDPKRLLLRRGAVYLEARGLDGDKLGLVALSRVRKVIPTPFFSPPETERMEGKKG